MNVRAFPKMCVSGNVNRKTSYLVDRTSESQVYYDTDTLISIRWRDATRWTRDGKHYCSIGRDA